MIERNQRDLTDLTMFSGIFKEACGECERRYEPAKLKRIVGIDLCEYCFERYYEAEQQDGGPFTVKIDRREYVRTDLREAESLAKFWKGKVYNGYSNPVEIFDFTKI